MVRLIIPQPEYSGSNPAPCIFYIFFNCVVVFYIFVLFSFFLEFLSIILSTNIFISAVFAFLGNNLFKQMKMNCTTSPKEVASKPFVHGYPSNIKYETEGLRDMNGGI